MNAIAPLFAINADLIQAIMVIAFLVLSGLAKLLSSMNKQTPKPTRPSPNLNPAPGPKPRPKDPVAGEVEDFLRRVAERNQSKTKGVRPASPPPKPAPAPVAADIVSERSVGGRVSEHVKKYMDEKEFKQRTQRLGSEVVQADSVFEQHLHKTFDHALGKLATVPGEASVVSVPVESIESADSSLGVVSDISDLHAVLGNPYSICQAIVLNEILRRPEERWG